MKNKPNNKPPFLKKNKVKTDRSLLFIIVAMSVTFLGIGRIVMQGKRIKRKKLLLHELENSLQILEIKLVKARLSTHFLNNTFMLLRKSLRHDPTKGVEYINLLSDIVHVYELNAQDGLIPIEEELAQLNRFVTIHAMRSNKRMFFNIRIEGDLSAVKIIPMMILTLTENMYKYGILQDETKPAKIFIHAKEDQLFMRFTNWINFSNAMPRSSGLGLKNIQTSLKLFYPNRHFFKAEKTKDIYQVEIVINK